MALTLIEINRRELVMQLFTFYKVFHALVLVTRQSGHQPEGHPGKQRNNYLSALKKS